MRISVAGSGFSVWEEKTSAISETGMCVSLSSSWEDSPTFPVEDIETESEETKTIWSESSLLWQESSTSIRTGTWTGAFEEDKEEEEEDGEEVGEEEAEEREWEREGGAGSGETGGREAVKVPQLSCILPMELKKTALLFLRNTDPFSGRRVGLGRGCSSLRLLLGGEDL